MLAPITLKDELVVQYRPKERIVPRYVDSQLIAVDCLPDRLDGGAATIREFFHSPTEYLDKPMEIPRIVGRLILKLIKRRVLVLQEHAGQSIDVVGQ
uniref:Uncharacterized protein n=1 Tax=Candidatus Kentrum sp. SD TaxID=2126332 RepID=A0A450YPU0_9GAMM|nr:MAG: hypothetical protein BECKSD772F_GA0070984_10284 [Candidatus Kentron sp. SD]VFK43548.1 MAG: hypothetical protein BECKSD772E_GA0070983_10274 [Candidatus Kentron sp. SD]